MVIDLSILKGNIMTNYVVIAEDDNKYYLDWRPDLGWTYLNLDGKLTPFNLKIKEIRTEPWSCRQNLWETASGYD